MNGNSFQNKQQFQRISYCLNIPRYGTVLRNGITEAFESRAISFITHRIGQGLDRQNWPSKGKMKLIGMYVYKVLVGNEHDPPGEAPNVPEPAQVAIDEVIMQASLGSTPISHDHLLASIDEYTQVLFGMLQKRGRDSNSSAIQDSLEITDQVDHGWFSSWLQAMPAYLNLPRRRRNRLMRSILLIMNDEEAEVHIGYQTSEALKQDLIALIHTTRRQLECSWLFLGGDPMIDLLNDVGVPIDYNHSDILRALTKIKNRFRVLYEHLNFSKVRLDNCARNIDLYSGMDQDPEAKLSFTNVIRTDGHTLKFIFAKRKTQGPPLPDLTLVDFIGEDMNDKQVIGVDPGMGQLFTAVDDRFEVARMSNSEWYAKAGFMQRRHQQQTRKQEAGISDLEVSLPTRKAASPNSWTAYCQAIFNDFDTLTSFYADQWTNDRFLAYIRRQRLESEAVCPLFQERTLQQVEALDTLSARMIKLWNAKHCTMCQHHWKQDHAAALNIRQLGLCELSAQPRPSVFYFNQESDTPSPTVVEPHEPMTVYTPSLIAADTLGPMDVDTPGLIDVVFPDPAGYVEEESMVIDHWDE
ncbi:hypothetical protein DFQ30_007682 [Apophysomyces sp. BC1015]|nr:hypothetical protein DFQ30_007682 [Apophysomyces sp. BC1015]KAG0175885.1 hypothetical protein DFQ29_006835 [Apophysomyces sp. BC1021]